MRQKDRFRGCLIGGAAGDALGYAVEFMQEAEIFRRYGPGGITGYDLTGGVARISDDTQMTLFTATGLLSCATRGRIEPYADCIARSYQGWLRTQERQYPIQEARHDSWLEDVPGLFSRRAPGNTCLSALRSGGGGTLERPINTSKGCGGVMRVAPIGLYFDDRPMDLLRADRLGAQAAAITHGHELGYIPAAALVHIVRRLSQDDLPVEEAIRDAIEAAGDLWPEAGSLEKFVRLMEKALRLAHGDMKDIEAIRQLGEGWVAEETLAIAAYCAAKYPDDFDRALIASVNHSGDSDSTGAVTGNILGARLGLSGIPAKYVENLELADLILEIADDLWRDCPHDERALESDPAWKARYLLNRQKP